MLASSGSAIRLQFPGGAILWRGCRARGRLYQMAGTGAIVIVRTTSRERATMKAIYLACAILALTPSCVYAKYIFFYRCGNAEISLFLLKARRTGGRRGHRPCRQIQENDADCMGID